MILEHVCVNDQCVSHGVVVEHYYHHDPGDLQCDDCGAVARRAVSRFSMPFSGPIIRYQDRKRKGYGEEAWTEWRIKSSTSGKPEPVRIESMADLHRFRREEGLIGPQDIGSPVVANDSKWTHARTAEEVKYQSGAMERLNTGKVDIAKVW